MVKKILIADDNQFFGSGLSKALRKFCDFHGEVKAVENGKDTIREIGSRFYDICLLDIKLPDLNGLDVMDKINEISPDTRIAIMTAGFISDDIRGRIDKGANQFLPKPVDISLLKAFVKRALGRGRVSYKSCQSCYRNHQPNNAFRKPQSPVPSGTGQRAQR